MSKKLAILGNIMLLGVLMVSIALTTSTTAVASVAAKPPTATPAGGPTPLPGNQISVYGVWHCGNHYCDWSLVRNTAPGGEFDVANHWIIDRGDGTGKPSVNLVVLAFLEPLKLLNQTTDAAFLNGVPRGMTADVMNYFKSKGIRVDISIGGITYTDEWEAALAANATLLGQRAAAVATQFDVGIEIDYERSTDPFIPQLQQFITAYRAVHAYDASGNNHKARLTIDLGVGNRWLTTLSRHATINWLDPSNPGVLDYANAMVPGTGQPSTSQWQEHITGMPQYNPPVPPKAPAKVAGSLWLTSGANPIPECTNFASSKQKAYESYVETVQPAGEGTTAGMLGYMFWAAECPSVHNTCTTPPNTCEGGMGVAAKTFNIPIPMPALRQQ